MPDSKTYCPSCRHKLSPMTTECPICGIPLSREPLKRPLLFQMTKNTDTPGRRIVNVPAHPVTSRDTPSANQGQHIHQEGHGFLGTTSKAALPPIAGSQSTFWQLARMEIFEAILLLIINSLIVVVVSWQLNLPPWQIYSSFWHFLAFLHFLASWAYFMLPILLTGSSPAMLLIGLGIADSQPEKRLSFSFFMLLSVALVPLSFLCMVLTPAHATLAEILTGQEIRERVPGLMRH